jgi:hypothetical protein
MLKRSLLRKVIVLAFAFSALIPLLTMSRSSRIGRVQASAVSAEEQETAPQANSYLPLLQKDLPPVIPATTEVLSAQTTDNLISVSEDGTTFTFAQPTAELSALDVGDVMVGDVSEAVPHGFLRKVTQVTNNSGQVIVTTEPATLEEAIEQGAQSTFHTKSRRLICKAPSL